MSADTPPPTPEDLQRELDAVRAAQPAPPPTPPRSLLSQMLPSWRSVRWVLLLWVLLILMFLGVWKVFEPPPRRDPSGSGSDSTCETCARG